MRQEERDAYIIPPNFIEGGALMGGMVKTRNVVEAGLLGALTALPVLRLGLSLTTRIIILCLTTLPLVLVALIGIGGGSLSELILQFFSFLRNRRTLDRNGADRGKKSMLPSWGHSVPKAEDSETPKSRNRLEVDLKGRKVDRIKTFLAPEVKPLNPLADYVPVETIKHGVIKSCDHRYVKILEVVPVNFLLRSAQEQRRSIYSFISYLKIAPEKVQFKALTKRVAAEYRGPGGMWAPSPPTSSTPHPRSTSPTDSTSESSVCTTPICWSLRRVQGPGACRVAVSAGERRGRHRPGCVPKSPAQRPYDP